MSSPSSPHLGTMESGQGALSISSNKPTNFKQRPPPGWVPYPGTKRKAHMADLGDNYDTDCRPSPAKQFAVDEEVATDILRDGYYYDPAIPPPPTKENVDPEDEVEMEEDNANNAPYAKGPGEPSYSAVSPSTCSSESMTKTKFVDGKECRDDDDSVVSLSHSMHESQTISSSSELVSSEFKSMIMNGLSLVLSDEIQGTLARRKLNEDFILPKSIMNLVSGAANNSMALVPWKPPMTTEGFISAQSQQVTTPMDEIVNQRLSFHQPNLETALESTHPSPPILPQPMSFSAKELIGYPLLAAATDEVEGECMEVDMLP